jgi:putative ABC transport system permease protein
MLFRHSVQTALRAITINKMRATLTMLGIIIGVTSVILVIAIGQGAQNLIISQVQGMGSRTISVQPGREPQGPSDLASALYGDSLKDREFAAITDKENVPGLLDAVPVAMVPGSVSYQEETYRGATIGASEVMTAILDIFPSEGSFFTDEDIRQRASVAVIGSEVKEELFGFSDALGEKIKIKDRAFVVVGILPKKGQGSLFNVDDMIIVPYTTAQRYLTGLTYYHEFIVRAKTQDLLDQTVRDIERTLRELHNITDPDKDDFHVHTQADIADRVGTITTTLTALLAAVAAISLLVGGIGIMNIMLVSVTERTREIGLRKAIGATNRDILVQFLLEAVTLTFLGGAIGILLGASLAFVIALLLSYMLGVDWVYIFPTEAAVLGFGVAALVGLMFGIYPARHAAHLNPIDALRYE